MNSNKLPVLVLCIAVLSLVGCAKAWVKPGGTDEAFNTDKYECLQRSQQQVTSYSYGVYGGSGGTEQKVNVSLFNSCMNAKGWSLQNKQDAIDKQDKLKREFEARQEQRKQERAFRCSDPQFAEIYAKTPCKASEPSFAQLDDGTKITQRQKENFPAWRDEVTKSNREMAADMAKYGGAKGAKISAFLLNSMMPKAEEDSRKLYKGMITWGEYNHKRKQLSLDVDKAVADIKSDSTSNESPLSKIAANANQQVENLQQSEVKSIAQGNGGGFGAVPVSQLPPSSYGAEQRKKHFVRLQEDQINQMVFLQTEPNGDKVFFQPNLLLPTLYNVQGAPIVYVYYSKPRDKSGLLQYQNASMLVDCRSKSSRGNPIQPGTLEEKVFIEACVNGK